MAPYTVIPFLPRHSRVGGNPESMRDDWIPAYAGMTEWGTFYESIKTANQSALEEKVKEISNVEQGILNSRSRRLYFEIRHSLFDILQFSFNNIFQSSIPLTTITALRNCPMVKKVNR
jgi:hypothetical protein